MDFRSDNIGGAAPEILEALIAANSGVASPYGDDHYSMQLQQAYSDLFEAEVDVLPVSTGTAANSLAIAAMTPPWGAVYCHETAHIHTTECSAPEFFSGGAKLITVTGDQYRIDPDNLSSTIANAGIGRTNKAQPSVLSLTQPTDYGTVYSNDSVAELSSIARRHNVGVHMDGARFANALAHLGCTPAQASWKAGVDILTLGATKNGALFAEALVVFDRSRTKELQFRCRRGGQVWSKMRFASAQLVAYVQDGLWLDLASRANKMATELSVALAKLPFVDFIAPVEINILQIRLPAHIIDGLIENGVQFYRRSATHIRLICRYDTPQSDVDRLLSMLRELNGTPAENAEKSEAQLTDNQDQKREEISVYGQSDH